jgi:hypothetical protein
LDQEVTVVNISHHGAHLKDVPGKFRMGDHILLERHLASEEFTIMWVKNPGGRTGEIGVRTSIGSSTFWKDALEHQNEEQLVPA